MPLSDIKIRNAKPAEKPVRLFDERGLYLEVSPAGGKWWRLKVQIRRQREAFSLGVYPDVSPKDARDSREECRKMLAGRVDPSENRKARKSTSSDRASNSFEVVTREWFAKLSPG
jgi:hypothetical protein